MKSIAWRVVAGILLLCMTTGICLPLTVMAEAWTLTTDKTEYTAGEPIYVTATGSGYDWVGLYEANPTGKASAAYWYYVAQDGHSSGDTVDIHNADYVNASDCPHLMGIPVGEYRIVLCPDNGYDVAKEVFITVKEPLPPENPSDILSTDKTEYREGEPILVTATGTGTDWVGLYKADDDVGSVPVGYWYYVAKDGNTSGEAVTLQNVAQFDGNRTDIAGIPAGDYKLVFMFNNSYQVITETYFTVLPIDKPKPPASVLYESAGRGIGRAAGTVTITAAAGALPFSYELWWGNADGRLEGYTSIAALTCTGKETRVTLPDHTIIPAGADRILVYASNNSEGREDLWADEAAVGMLPADVAEYSFGDVKKEFAVLGDLHLFSDNEHVHNKHFAAALADIQAVAPNAAGIFINGDVTDHGIDSEFAAYRALLEAAGELPPVYAAVGERDLFGQGTDAMRIKRFLTGTGNTSETVYFDVWIQGIHCIFLGSEKLTEGDAELSETQLTWLSGLLDQDKADGRMAFVFLHQGLSKTVAGTKNGQTLGDVAQDKELRAILEKHPEVALFTGHSHWSLQSEDTLVSTTGKLPTMLNTAATAMLWDDAAHRAEVSIEGAQGYYIYVYEKQIVFAARDFMTGQWLTDSLFVIDTARDLSSDTPDTQPPAQEDDTTDSDTADTTAVDTTPEPGTAANTVAESGTGSPDSESTTEPAKGGCGSLIGSAVAPLMMMGGAIVLATRHARKKED